MIGRGRKHRVFAYGGPVDLRKGFDGLSALVAQELGCDPLSGDLFLFVSRNRQRAKVLMWDGTGLCVYAKRLEQGRFACLWDRQREGRIELQVGGRWEGGAKGLRRQAQPSVIEPRGFSRAGRLNRVSTRRRARSSSLERR